MLVQTAAVFVGRWDGEQALHLGHCMADVGGSTMITGNGLQEEEQGKTPLCYPTGNAALGWAEGGQAG